MTHTPVLLHEMLDMLSPKDGEIYVDATFGGGGYTKAILERAACKVYAFDRDPEAVKRGESLAAQFPGRLSVHQATFSTLEHELNQLGVTEVNGVVFDLGISSFQIDQAERGFSFRFEGPLDMRMSQEGVSAADVVNTFSEQDLAEIIYRYGEERFSRRIAKAIVQKRQESTFSSTKQLSDLIASTLKRPPTGQNPATLTFQALRIFVNNELIEIEIGLKMCKNILIDDGRLVIVTFHSLEDRLVKNFLRPNSQTDMTQMAYAASNPDFELLTRKPIVPTAHEIATNPRSRSAKLRAAIRLPITGC